MEQKLKSQWAVDALHEIPRSRCEKCPKKLRENTVRSGILYKFGLGSQQHYFAFQRSETHFGAT
jgi:predicted nucleic acid-binding Zn ribbon protein